MADSLAFAPTHITHIWRIDQDKYAATWTSGEGSYQVGGRWNSRGRRAVYASLDAATAILEVAVHKGFQTLDVKPHTLTRATLSPNIDVHIVTDIPNPNWLVPGVPSRNQQAFGDDLLAKHGVFAVQSVVSRYSWNIVMDASSAEDVVIQAAQERFALDPRLQP